MLLELIIALKYPLIIVQAILAIVLILMVLLQSGKGDDIGSAFGAGGGGSSSVLGAGGASKFLVRGTVIFVTLFMLNSIVLAKIFKEQSHSAAGTSVSEPLVPAPEAASPTPATAPADSTTPAGQSAPSNAAPAEKK